MMDAIIEESRNFSATASVLLQEYTKKLEAMRKEVERLGEPANSRSTSSHGPDLAAKNKKLSLISQTYQRLEHGLMNLARSTSQRLEHSELDDAARLELQIRLADLEASMHRIRMTFDLVRSAIHE